MNEREENPIWHQNRNDTKRNEKNQASKGKKANQFIIPYENEKLKLVHNSHKHKAKTIATAAKQQQANRK